MIFKEGTIVEGTQDGEKFIGAVVCAKELLLHEAKTVIFKVIFQNDMTNTAVYTSAIATWGPTISPERRTHLIVGKNCPGEVTPL